MNKVLKQLIEEAQIKFESHPHHPFIDTATIIESDLEKLAELIVNKCAEAIQQDTRINWLNAVQISRELRDILRD